MIIKKPSFWDLSKPNFISDFLLPFTFPILLRNFFLTFLKKKPSSNIKTLCIGNIYLGGTGKTPLTIKIYEVLNKLKYKTATVKKDYSNQKDEQLLLDKKTRLIIKKSRKEAVQQGIKENFDFLIFDDGLQEINLEYDFKIACFKTKQWIGNGRLIPAGPLRENVSSLKRFDAVFLNGDIKKEIKFEKEIKKINPKIKIFKTFYKISNKKKFNLNLKYLIFSGIGNPIDFKEILLIKKFKISQEMIFPDHYNYKDYEFEYIIDNATNKKLKILTTEKDYMKVPTKYRNKIDFISIDLIIEKENELIDILKKLK